MGIVNLLVGVGFEPSRGVWGCRPGGGFQAGGERGPVGSSIHLMLRCRLEGAHDGRYSRRRGRYAKRRASGVGRPASAWGHSQKVLRVADHRSAPIGWHMGQLNPGPRPVTDQA